MSEGRCRICGREQELVKRGSDLRDEHDCKPVGCPVASKVHRLADGSLCDDPRHEHEECREAA